MARPVAPSNWASILGGVSLKQRQAPAQSRPTLRAPARPAAPPVSKGWGQTKKINNVTQSDLNPNWGGGVQANSMAPQALVGLNPNSPPQSAPQQSSGSFGAPDLQSILHRGGGILGNAGDAQSGPVPAGMGQYASIPGVAGNAIKLATAQLGDPYVWGAGRNLANANPGSFDCSGLTYWAYGRAGIKLASTAAGQYAQTRHVGNNVSQFKPGDLVFFNFGRLGSQADHVGIYLGNNQFIHAPNSRSSVKVSQLSGAYAQHLMGAGRPA